MENVRAYGQKPFKVAVVHGGPGATGDMAPVARQLSSVGGVLEPLQTTTSIEGQVQELKAIIEQKGDIPLALIGFSWGAWLSFIVAAQYPELINKLILISSSPFEARYAADIMKIRLSRLDHEKRGELLSLMNKLNDPSIKDKDRLMAQLGGLTFKADSFEPLPHGNDILAYQYHVYLNVWAQAEVLRSSGNLLQLGKSIKCPVVAIHGDHDPHPAAGVKEPLSHTLKEFHFILLEKCGHYPWLERNARDKFHSILKREIIR